jgi:hypothetical protein
MKLDNETIKQIALELRAIKLQEGQCLVCGHSRVSEGCIDNIIKILEKNKANSEVSREFIRLFGACESCLTL